MKHLQQIINAHLRNMIIILMAAILLVVLGLQTLSAQGRARDEAAATFVQVGQLLHQNQQELKDVEARYRETCLLNAEVIAYVVRTQPELLGSVEAFRELAYRLQVDEIHIFDETGRIFTGTHPEHFGMTFDSGEQIGFFKPLLKDHSLRLCQDITPNTAESKLVQYSALWSSDDKFIVQVGMYPDAVLSATEKNEPSYIFSLLQGNPGISLYAIDPDTQKIIGSTSGSDVGKDMAQLGFSPDELPRLRRGMHVKVNGVKSFAVFGQAADTLVGYVIANDQLYGNVIPYTAVLALCLVLIAIVMVLMMKLLIGQYILDSITDINGKLRAIGSGNLDERADVRSSTEFSELSDHINQMVQRLLASTDKMSAVLNRTNLRIGVYEYNTAMKTARFTEHVPEIFGLTLKEMHALAADHSRLAAFLDRVRQEPILERENTYRFVGKEEMYLTLEEMTNGSHVLGIVMDVTEETLSLRRAETERDMDLLTGLFNRRGMMRRLENLFTGKDEPIHGAMVMLDADGLKQVNDSHGHLVGDQYLKRLADLLHDFSAPTSLLGRIGGDEFLMLVHGYEDESEVLDAMIRLRFLQKNTVIHLDDGSEVPLRFSFGYVLIHGRDDYHAMINEADGYMYHMKNLRKQSLHRGEESPDN